MGAYVMRRLMTTVIILFGVASVTFLIMRVLPGDPALAILGPEATKEDIEQLRLLLGTGKPVYEQYVLFMFDLARGNLGVSLVMKEPVLKLILSRLQATLEIALPGMALGAMLSVPLGVVAAVRRNSASDHLSRIMAMLGASLPPFLFGIMFILMFSVVLPILPPCGRGPVFVTALLAGLGGGGFSALSTAVTHLVLPSVTLAAPLAAVNVRLMRSSMLEVLNQDYMTTARAKGLPERMITYKHALRNALIPVVTMMGMQFSRLIGGSFVIENMFAWPGLGRLTIVAIQQRDYPVVQGVIIVVAFGMAMLNLAVDLMYCWIDPRIRFE